MGKTYFASDFHLGIEGRQSSRERERKIVRWLELIRQDAEALYLVGDVFDYWFEYGRVVPKGYLRLLGKLAELRDAGLPIYFFTGNHDMWVFRYFEEELGIPTYRQPIVREIGGKTFLIGHGDGLGPGDHGYKFLKKALANPLLQWLFARLHPNFGLWLMTFSSGTSRSAQEGSGNHHFHGEAKERLVQFCNAELERTLADFFVFGHRHLPIDFVLKNGKSRYINLGDWLEFSSYAVFDAGEMELKFFENEQGRTFGSREDIP